jgi:hypothetical protein
MCSGRIWLLSMTTGDPHHSIDPQQDWALDSPDLPCLCPMTFLTFCVLAITFNLLMQGGSAEPSPGKGRCICESPKDNVSKEFLVQPDSLMPHIAVEGNLQALARMEGSHQNQHSRLASTPSRRKERLRKRLSLGANWMLMMVEQTQEMPTQTVQK